MHPERFIGLMSGTSLDGVDAALVRFSPAPMLEATQFTPFPEDLRQELLALHSPGNDELHRAAMLSQRLARLYAEATRLLLESAGVSPAEIVALGCHGQTVRHRPELGYTLQLNNPALLAEISGIPVVADFRSRDMAAGGQGAPLVPAFHAGAFRSQDVHRVILNLGGIANITNLPADHSQSIKGFDTGPGNMLLDAWAAQHLGAPRDDAGHWAASGAVNEGLLASCLADPWFSQTPPKSTGRDHFHLQWLDRQGISGIPPQNVQATLSELTAASITLAIAQWCPGASEVYACGGGVHNRDLMNRLARRLAQIGQFKVTTTDALGIPADWVEAVAFAWLAKQTVENRAGNLPAVTGASGQRVLGALYPR